MSPCSDSSSSSQELPDSFHGDSSTSCSERLLGPAVSSMMDMLIVIAKRWRHRNAATSLQACTCRRCQAAKVQPGPLFDVSVTIPSEAMQWRSNPSEWESKHLAFAVDVKALSSEASWTVYKRYSDFHALRLYYEHLGGCDRSVAFPRKTFRTCEGSRLEKRREKLEHWLQQMVQPIHGACVGPLQAFLELEDHSGDYFDVLKQCKTASDIHPSNDANSALNGGQACVLSLIMEESLRSSLMSSGLNASITYSLANSISRETSRKGTQEKSPEQNHEVTSVSNTTDEENDDASESSETYGSQ